MNIQHEFKFLYDNGKSLRWFSNHYGIRESKIYAINSGTVIFTANVIACIHRCKEEFSLKSELKELRKQSPETMTEIRFNRKGWKQSEVDQLVRLRAGKKLSCTEIGKIMKRPRCSILGKAHRLGI